MDHSHPDQWFGNKTYSQHGEDLLFLNIFYKLNIEKPNYLDIGAHHPLNISNTALLYQRGSRGVNIEANPNLIEAFKKERPEDVTLNIGIANIHEDVECYMYFYMIDDWSGRNSFNKDTIEEFIKKNPNFRVTKKIEVPVVNINSIYEKYFQKENKECNLLCLDTEGLDLDILNSMKFNPLVICVEHNEKNKSNILEVLTKKEYFKVIEMGMNSIFIKEYLYTSYLK